jgi:uncharacterized membrane protein YedE/YeeE
MQLKKESLIGATIIISSGIIILISQFVDWSAGLNALELYRLASFERKFYIYIVPLASGIIVCIIGILLAFDNRVLKKIAFVLIIIVLNLLFFFLAEALDYHGIYIWNYMGIYIIIVGSVCFFIGLLYTLMEPGKPQ